MEIKAQANNRHIRTVCYFCERSFKLGEVDFSVWVDDERRGSVCKDCCEAGRGGLSKTILQSMGRYQEAIEFYKWLTDQDIKFPTEEEVEAAQTEYRKFFNLKCGKCEIPNIEHLPKNEKHKGANLDWIEEHQMWLCGQCQ